MGFINSVTYAATSITTAKCPTGNYQNGILRGLPCDKPVSELKWILAVANNAMTYYLLPLAGTVFVIMVIIGGLQYITSNGNPQRVEAGKKTLTFAIGGLILMLLAKVLVGLTVTFLGGNVN